MAQATKSRAQSARSKTTKRKATKARKPSTVKSRSSRNGASSNGVGHGVAEVAKKAKTPLLAGGAAVAGAAGGLALGVHQARKSKVLRRPMVKVDSHDLARAAKNVGEFGMHVGELASELRRNREESDGSKRRSPIEVVLEGLTSRGHKS
jgi:hypothetical protein